MGIMEILATICGILAIICLITFFITCYQFDNKIAQRIAIVSSLCTIVFAILTLIFGIIYNKENQEENQYTITAVAEDTNYLKTKDGNIWRVKDDLEVGKEYEVKFDSKGTDNIIDDEILEIN